MRKKKKKYANLVILLLILFVLFFIVLQNRTIKITTEELIQDYQSNIIEADKQFLGKQLEISGQVKSFIQTEGKKSLLELQSANPDYKLFCKLMNQIAVKKCSSFTSGTNVVVIGKCVGLTKSTNEINYSEIYIEAEQIK